MKTHPDHFLRGPYIIDHTNYASGDAFSDALKQIGEALQETPPLTKREYFAAMALQGLAAECFTYGPGSPIMNSVVSRSVELADALIKELNK